MPAPEIRAVPLDGADLLVGEHDCFLAGVSLEPKKALVASLDVVAEPWCVARTKRPQCPGGRPRPVGQMLD